MEQPLWRAGDVVDRSFDVVRLIGMGRTRQVYQVRHRHWSLDLAAIVPNTDVLQAPGEHARFVREAAAWLGLWSHPNVCRCHYVREIAGVPVLFAEYLPDGDLPGWIEDGRLYQGAPGGALLRILDIAIQLAWGLDHVQGRTPVNRSIEPATILIDSSGGDIAVKVTGLGGTDVHGYAESVRQMFTGTREPMTTMPTALAALLERCTSPDPSPRPGPMRAVAAEIIELYREVSGGIAYPRMVPQALEPLADELSNHATSLLDLGRADEADQLFRAALRADPRHLAATYNSGLLRWRRGAVTDEGLLGEIEALRADLDDTWQVRRLSSLIHMERGDLVSAGRLLIDLADDQQNAGDLQDIAELLWTSTDAHARRLAAISIPWQNYTRDAIPPEHSIRLTPDHRFALTGGADRAVSLWDVHSGRRVRRLSGHTDRVCSVDISADGQYGISAGWDRTVRFWDLAGGRQIRSVDVTKWINGNGPERRRRADEQNELNRIAGRRYNLCKLRADPDSLTLNTARSAVRVNRDGSVAMWAEPDGRIQVWDLRTGRHSMTLDGAPGLRYLEVVPDGRYALSSNHAGLQLWNLTYGNCPWQVADYPGTIHDLWLGPGGDHAVVLGGDKVIRVWDLVRHRCVRAVRLPSDSAVKSAALSADSRFLLLGDSHGPLTYWDLAHGRCLRTFRAHHDTISAVSLGPDDRTALSAGFDNVARSWRLPGGFSAPAQLTRPYRHSELNRAAAQHRALLAAARDATTAGRCEEAFTRLTAARSLTGFERTPRVMTAWRALGDRVTRTGLRSAWPAATLAARTGEYRDSVNGRSLDLTSDARLGVYSDVDGRLQIWDLTTGLRSRVIDSQQRSVDQLRLASDGGRLVSAGDGTIKAWSMSSGEGLASYNVPRLHRAVFDADARLALVSHRGTATMTVWDLLLGKELHSLTPTGRATRTLWISPDGNRAIAVNDSDLISLWEPRSGRCLRTVQSPLEYVLSVCLSGDTGIVLAAAGGGIAMLDAATGDTMRRFVEPRQSISHQIEASSDGRFLFTASTEPVVRVWDVSTGACVRRLDGQMRGTTTLSVTPDANYLFTADRDETLRLWALDWELAV